jgi:hypothetical protein
LGTGLPAVDSMEGQQRWEWGLRWRNPWRRRRTPWWGGDTGNRSDGSGVLRPSVKFAYIAQVGWFPLDTHPETTVHWGRVWVRVFIGVSVRVCCEHLRCTV